MNVQEFVYYPTLQHYSSVIIGTILGVFEPPNIDMSLQLKRDLNNCSE